MKEDKKENKVTKSNGNKKVKNVKKVVKAKENINKKNKQVEAKPKKEIVEIKEEKIIEPVVTSEEIVEIKEEKVIEPVLTSEEDEENSMEITEEKVIETVVTSKEQKKPEVKELNNYEKMKGISRAISFLARVMEIVTKIGIVALMIAAIVIPFIMRKFEFTRSYIILNDRVIDYTIKNNRLNMFEQGNEIASIQLQNIDNVNDITELLAEKSNFEIGLYLVIIVICAAAILFLMALLFKMLNELFDNIAKGKTPFTKNNIKLIKKLPILIIAVLVLPYIVSLFFGLTTGIWAIVDINFMDIIIVLIVLAMAYVFEYGYELQSEVNKKND